MGKLRLEPKIKAMDREHYNMLLETLKEARSATRHARVFWDLEEGENASAVRRDFMHVAQKEKIALTIRRPRGASALELRFDDKGAVVDNTPKRIPAEESRNRILKVLEESNGPMRKADIVSASEISSSTWNARIKELMAEGRVKRKGRQREATYTLA
ncbi:MAG: winged helix-turn-helix transcriptional regulator [Acidobacteriota bacterium]|nr:winged helix-turn-helix transcriptional regulator [Acidobacteriota bacterium]